MKIKLFESFNNSHYQEITKSDSDKEIVRLANKRFNKMKIKVFEDFDNVGFFRELTSFEDISKALRREIMDFTDDEIERLISVLEGLNVLVEKKSREELESDPPKKLGDSDFYAYFTLDRYRIPIGSRQASYDAHLLIRIFKSKRKNFISAYFNNSHPPYLQITITKLEDEWFHVDLVPILTNPDLPFFRKNMPHIPGEYECDQFLGLVEFIKQLFKK
jgi:hypothetical protein